MYPFQAYQNTPYAQQQQPPQRPPQQQGYNSQEWQTPQMFPQPSQPHFQPQEQLPPVQPQQPPPQQSYYAPQPGNVPMYSQIPDYLISTCNRNKKALFVGINYFHSRNKLNGCINDCHNVKNFICERFGFPNTPQNILMLTDDNNDPNYQPTKQNIINAIGWLVGGAQSGDSLFFHYSGHGGLVRDLNGDEQSGYDSCIYPVDFEQVGPIIDDDLNTMMVHYLPVGVRLTVIFDCCHSGTGLDLPFTYRSDGSLVKYTPMDTVTQVLQSGLLKGGGLNVQAIAGLVSNVLNNNNKNQASNERTKNSMADVIMFSGCKESQTSKDTFIGGVGATGAMSHALLRTLTQSPNQTYLSLLGQLQSILTREYDQTPQLSTGRPMNMNAYFIM